MPIVTVTPKYVNSPKGQSRYGSLNCDGTYYSFNTDKIRMQDFTKGEPVTVEYTETDKDGKTYFNITRIVRDGAAAQTPAANGNTSNGHAKERDETITRLAIAKSCIEAKETTETANRWLAWVKSGAPF